MSKQRRRKRRIERIKSILIVLLSCSAIYLAARTQMSSSLANLAAGGDTVSHTATVQNQSAMARPLRMAVTLREGVECQRYGVQYDQTAGLALFQQTYSLLAEALSGAQEPQRVQESQWQQALSSAPGIYFDWQEPLPFGVLEGWLSVENSHLTGSMRRMVLTVSQGETVAFYHGEDGYYRVQCQGVDASRLSELAAGLKDNGARFAFEVEGYEALGPYTMLTDQTPSPASYQSTNPLEQGDMLSVLQEQLNFDQSGAVSYPTSEEQVIRVGDDTLRVANDGTVTYTAAEEGSGRYTVGEDLYQMVEGCRELAMKAILPFYPEARLSLLSVQGDEENGWQVRFSYVLNDIRVRMGQEDCAASFQISGGQVTGFTLRLRTYTDTGSTSLLLPEIQAMAAMQAVGHEGEELLLVYLDNGTSVSASWAAAGVLGEEG